VKTLRSKSGPFDERPYYDRIDVERICLDELKAVGLLPAEPSPVRIERFIEKRFKVEPSYEEMDRGVLGYSCFGARGLEAVVISRAFAEDCSLAAERRLSTTLAHEAGHALLHGHLFALGAPQPGLFGEEVTEPKILCRDVEPSSDRPRKYDGRWWEFQANLAIGALLLPAPLVVIALGDLAASVGHIGVAASIPDRCRSEAAARLARLFEVNPIVARLRLNELYPAAGRQLTL